MPIYVMPELPREDQSCRYSVLLLCF